MAAILSRGDELTLVVSRYGVRSRWTLWIFVWPAEMHEISSIINENVMWWHYTRTIMTSLNGSISRFTGPLWLESNGYRWIPPKKGQWRVVWWFFDLRLNKRLSKQSSRRWYEKPSRSLCRHCYEICRPSHVASSASTSLQERHH